MKEKEKSELTKYLDLLEKQELQNGMLGKLSFLRKKYNKKKNKKLWLSQDYTNL
tara:strand:+ start:3666 stop:3827 length:162 start_codon:yes stop_codon:yes gene_type:complete